MLVSTSLHVKLLLFKTCLATNNPQVISVVFVAYKFTQRKSVEKI